MERTKRKLAAVISAVILALTAMLCLMPHVSADTVTVGDFTVTGGTENTDYKYENNVLTILTETSLTISGTTTTDRIEVENGAAANITLENVNIDVSTQGADYAAFKIADNSTGDVTITLVGSNKLKSGGDCAGLQKNGDASNIGTLEIKGTGSLEAEGGIYGAGIGGGEAGTCSNITISGGTVTATSKHGAGIGGGDDCGTGSNITISGGTVTATSTNGAGIGGGDSGGVGSNITISNGTITATSTNGAGIGGGDMGGVGSNITISGGTVTAKSQDGAGIGGGYFGSGSDIKISGGSVKAESTSANAIEGGSAKTPTLDGTTPVYLLEIENPNDKTVLIDNKIYTPINHKAADISDGKLYAYLTGENHTVQVGDEVTTYSFDSSTSSFVRTVFGLTVKATETGTTLVNGTDYTYSNGVLTVKSTTPITISNTDTSTSTTDRIEVENGAAANITLENVNIDVSTQGADYAAFKIADNSTGDVTITLVGSNKLKSGGVCAGLQKNGDASNIGTLEIKGTGSLEAIGRNGGAGIGGCIYQSTSKITISGGTVTATGTSGAGIGGGYEGSGSDITISEGTVTATGTYGAGIGGGEKKDGSNITISGGTVTAKSTDGAGIGGGLFVGGSNIKISGGSVKAESTTGNAVGSGGYGGSAETPTLDGTTPVYLLEIENPDGKPITINNKPYPTNHNGEKKIYAYLTGENHTVQVGDEVITYSFDSSTSSFVRTVFGLTVKATETGTTLVYGTDYTYSNGVLTVKSTTPITISNADTSTSTTDRIEVENGVAAKITLENVNIDVSTAAFKIADNSTGDVTITLVGSNKLKSGGNYAGLQKNGDASNIGTLEIKGTGSLEAIGRNGGAGIGGCAFLSTSKITISGGTVTATGTYGAGIGGGSCGGNGSNITISGGTVTATSTNGAGIGGGDALGTGSNITISNGTVTATSTYGAGIGGGINGGGSDITISEGTVTATSTYGAGIGGGGGGNGSNITISGGTVTATSTNGAGIGGGEGGRGSDIKISGGSVKAESTTGNAVGGGVGGSAETPTLDGTTPVYLLEIENPDGKSITINNKPYPTNHNGEKKIYAYLPAGTASSPNTVTVGTQASKYHYDTAAGKWVKVCAHNNVQTNWSYDSTGHWHICNDCSEKVDFAQHTEDSGTVTVQPTETTKGVRTYSCKVCRYVIRTTVIPATGASGSTSRPTTPSTSTTNTTTATHSPKLTVKVKASGNKAVLSWNKLKNADSYVIYQYKNGKYVKIKTTANTSVTFKNLTNGKTYRFMVRYTVNGRTYSTGIEAKAAVKVYYKPIVTASAENTRIKLSWKAVPNAEKYAVYKYADGKAVKLAETKNLSVIIKKLEPDTEYQYIVRAYADGEWTEMKRSDIVTVRTKA